MNDEQVWLRDYRKLEKSSVTTKSWNEKIRQTENCTPMQMTLSSCRVIWIWSWFFITIIQTWRGEAYSANDALYKQILNDVISTIHPKLTSETLSNQLHLSSSPNVLPEHLVFQFLESRMGQKHSSSTDKVTRDLIEALSGCIMTDSKCSLLMGNLYFQGLVPFGLLNSFDSSKNLTRAIGLWRYSASKGNSEAQYKLGLLFSTFYNPPSFLMDPLDLFSSTGDEMTTSKNGIYSDSGVDESIFSTVESSTLSLKEFDNYINHLTLDLSQSIDLLLFTMEVFDADNMEDEAQILQSWINERSNHNISRCEKRNNQVNIDATNTEEKVCEPESLLKNNPQIKKMRSFPLYKKESLAILYLYAAAQGGHIGAQLALGFRHVYGLGVPRRCTVGATYYLHVARQVAQISATGIPPVAEIIRLDIDSITGEGHSGRRMQSHVTDLQQHLADTGHPRIQTAVAKKYLLGVDGCQQNFHLAVQYFKQAAMKGYKEAMSWLGYLSALGIGVEKNYDLAMKLFLFVLSVQNDPMAHNGLGFLYFVGTPLVPSDIKKAMHHFTLSAAKEFPDGQYNLATLYLTGTGVEQSFSKSLRLLSKAVEQGHSSAMYLLGIMHFNGLGTLRECSIAAGLFKRVAERHRWVAERLKKAYSLQTRHHQDEAAFVYWELAESGIEFVQANLAELLDGGGHPLAIRTDGRFGFVRSLVSYVPGIRRRLFVPTALFSLDQKPSLGVNRAFAHRYWDLAALQRSTQALIRLGDYAYHGWGIEPAPFISRQVLNSIIHLDDDITNRSDKLIDSGGESMEGWGNPRRRHDTYRRRYKHQYEEAYHFYDRASYPQRPQFPTPKQNKPHMIKATYILSHMHEGGYGVPQDLQAARRQLNRISEMDSEDSKWIVQIALLILRFKSFTNYLHHTSLVAAVHLDYRLFFVLANVSIIFLLQFLRPFIHRFLG